MYSEDTLANDLRDGRLMRRTFEDSPFSFWIYNHKTLELRSNKNPQITLALTSGNSDYELLKNKLDSIWNFGETRGQFTFKVAGISCEFYYTKILNLLGEIDKLTGFIVPQQELNRGMTPYL